MNKDDTASWTTDTAADYYGIRNWGAGFFDVSASGEVIATVPADPDGGPARQASLPAMVQGLHERGLDMPVLLRIENLLDASVSQLNLAFATAIDEAGYDGEYRGVFPIKVNQQRHVVEDLVNCGARYHHGLEAGSKAELLIAMSMLRDPQCLIVCNGYKDEEFISLGLHARELGMKCVFVVETLDELGIIIERSRAMTVSPMIGVRLKLSTQVAGRWQNDSGDRSMFGLSTLELMDVIDQLREAGMLHNLELLHYHLGSQIADIRSIREGAREACRYYVDLVREGAALTYLDLGGGLGVDYDGSRSAGEQSRNYSLAEYCGGVVEAIQESLAGEEIPHPTIVTESGRATAAYSSVLLFNILGVGHFEPRPVAESVADDSDERVAALWQVLQEVTANNAQQSHNNAGYYFDTLVDAFKRGEASLRQRAAGENLYLAILQSIVRLLPEMQRVPVELEGLQQRLSDIYYGNFSVFQSLPDSWAIQQLFPVMPIHRLQEEPTRLGMIADLTCDCDGKLSRFVTGDGEQGTLALHPLNSGEDYHLGVFLTGAYQETLGDLHNLFGDTNVASVRIKEDGALEFVHELHGDSIADVLGYVEYNTTELYQRFRATAEAAVVDKKISVQQRQRMLSAFTDSLRGYTYFEN